jgi:three-Cys-motif partner protein
MSQENPISNVDGMPVRPSGLWIKRKHYFLQQYADIFTKGMIKKWQGRLTFIDLYAGPGKCVIKETAQEPEGSPLLALQYDFNRYVFVEETSSLMAALQTRCSQSPKKDSIKFLQVDCNQCIQQIINEIPPGHLSLAFIDPTDIDIHYATIKALAQISTGVDLLMNIQYGMDLKRNFDSYLKRGEESKLSRFLRSDFDISQLKGKEAKDVIEVYKSRIRELGYQTVEHRDITVTNTKNAPMYFLLFASKDPRGLDFWQKISKKDEQGQWELF